MSKHLIVFTVLLGTAALSFPAMAADLVLYNALDFVAAVVAAFTATTGLTVDVVEPGSTGETWARSRLKEIIRSLISCGSMAPPWSSECCRIR